MEKPWNVSGEGFCCIYSGAQSKEGTFRKDGGGGSQQLGTDPLLQKSQKSRFMWEVPPAPPWLDGSLLTLATDTGAPSAPEPQSQHPF